MSEKIRAEREQILSCALRARTLPEIEAGIQAVQEWLRSHPDDVGAEDILEPLTMLWEGLQTETSERDCVPVSSSL